MSKLYLIGISTHGVGKILSQAAPVALIMVMSRYVSIEELGFLSFIIAVVSIFSTLSELGLSNSQNKFLVEDVALLSPILNWEIVLALLVGSFLLLIDLTTNCFSGYGFYLFLVTVASSFSVIVSVFSGMLFLVESGLYQTLASILFFAGTLFLFFKAHFNTVDSVLLARIGSWGILNFFMLLRLYFSGLYHWAWKLPKTVWLFAFHTFWFSSVELVVAQVDVLMVKAILGDRWAGVFKPASLLGVAPMVLGTLIAAPLLSILSRQIIEAPLHAWLLTRKLAVGLFLMLVIIFLGVSLLSQEILAQVFTPAIALDGSMVFLLMLASTCLYVVGMPLQEFFLAKGDSSYVGRIATLRLVIFIVTALPSVYHSGILGISLVHFLIYLVSFVAYVVKFNLIRPTQES